MEKSSEKKPKRGRPKTISKFVDGELGDELGALGSLGPTLIQEDPGESKRIRQNRAYAHLFAFPVLLESEEEFSWLLETRGPGSRGSFKRFSLLAELGRIVHPEGIRHVAREICQMKPKVREGIVYIRRQRLQVTGKEVKTKGNAEQLFGELVDTYNNYIDRYPDTPTETLAEALDYFKQAVVLVLVGEDET